MDIALPSDEISIFTAVNIERERCTSVLHIREKKTCNHVIRFNEYLFGKIHLFFEVNKIELMVVETLDINKREDHICKVSPGKFIVAEIATIDEKITFYSVNHNSFICSRPNAFEKD